MSDILLLGADRIGIDGSYGELDRAVRYGGPNEGVSPITIAEDWCLSILPTSSTPSRTLGTAGSTITPLCFECQASCLPATVRVPHGSGMFVVTEADAAAIRAAFDQAGELSAVVELRRRFPGITDNAHARTCARSIVGWTPLPTAPCTVTRLRPGKRG